MLAKWNPRGTMFAWRSSILRLFGAQVEDTVFVYPSCEIWDPRNLKLKKNATIDQGVKIFNVAFVSIGENSIISRDATICTASHNYQSENFELITKPVMIQDNAWICMEAFVAPGVTIKAFGVALARSVVLKDIEESEIHKGNPAKFIKLRNKIEKQF